MALPKGLVDRKEVDVGLSVSTIYLCWSAPHFGDMESLKSVKRFVSF